jgi:CubicO group peptidase (beta-lactamase class C family)
LLAPRFISAASHGSAHEVKALLDRYVDKKKLLLNPGAEPTSFFPTQGTYGWQGAAGTVTWVDRVRGIHAALMTQYMSFDPS